MFSQIFSKSWEEYKINYKTLIPIVFLFSFLPYLVVAILSVPLKQEYYNPATFSYILSVWSSPYYYFIIALEFCAILLSVFMSASLIRLSLSKKKLNFKEAVAEGKKNFFRFLLFSIVFAFFLTGLFILLVIPGIIFAVYWIFSNYIFLEKKKGIREALKESHDIVRGKWWRTLGISILFFLVLLLFILVIGIAQTIVAAPFISESAISQLTYSYSIIDAVFLFLSNLIAVPLSLFFFKNLYLEMKKNKKSE